MKGRYWDEKGCMQFTLLNPTQVTIAIYLYEMN